MPKNPLITNILAIEIETLLTHLESQKHIDSKCHQFLSPTSKTWTLTFLYVTQNTQAQLPE